MKQIKSRQRVKDFAEVFTAEREVKAMVDLVWDNFPDDEVKIKATYMEPSCGTGNFLVEILERKLNLVPQDLDETQRACKIIDCYGSLYGVDIQDDNVKETRERLLAILPMKALTPLIEEILNRQIIVGDFLKMYGYEEPKKKNLTLNKKL